MSWLVFERAATAIVGFDQATTVPGAAFEQFVTALVTNQPAVIACDARMIARDALAYRLAMVGYSTRDVGILLLGEASQAEVDADYARGLAALPRSRPTDTARPVVAALMPTTALPGETATAGRIVRDAGAADVSSTLARSAPARAWSTLPTPGARAWSDQLDAQIRRYAGAYNVDYRLVGAMIRQESNGLQASVSSKGAIGLMQLMPATAAMLNVNPRDPVDNIRGGIAYLAGLLRTYGDLRYALIAYNAGPTHANQVIRGERGLFAETRRYLAAIATMYPLN